MEYGKLRRTEKLLLGNPFDDAPADGSQAAGGMDGTIVEVERHTAMEPGRKCGHNKGNLQKNGEVSQYYYWMSYRFAPGLEQADAGGTEAGDHRRKGGAGESAPKGDCRHVLSTWNVRCKNGADL